MHPTTVHDIIVVGTNPGALMAAGMLRRMSYRVMIVGQGGSRDSYENEGEKVPALFYTLPPRGFSRILDSVFDDLNLEDKVHQLGLDQDHHLQVITPDTRLDVFSTHDDLASELRRAVPDQAKDFLRAVDTLAQLNKLLEDLIVQRSPISPSNLFEKLSMTAIQRRFEEKSGRITTQDLLDKQPPMMRAIINASAFLSNMEPQFRSPAATARLSMMFLKGTRLVFDLDEKMHSAIENIGVEVAYKMMIEKLLIQGRKVTGFQALRSSSTYSCQAMITGRSISEMVDLVPSALRRARAKLAAAASRFSSSLFSVNLIVPQEAIPLGMANQILLVRKPESKMEGENLIRVLVLPYPHREDRVQINLSCMVPYKKRSLGREYLAPLQNKLLEALQWLVPFTKKFDMRQSSPFWTSRATDSRHPSPWSIHNTFELLDKPLLGITHQSPKTPLKNLLLCGPSIFPALGLEGQALASYRVVDWIEKNHKLKKVLP